jgi:sec-independent protein translocase protein TatC
MIGVAFCYFFVFQNVFRYINEFAPKAITIAPDIENYFDFVVTMCLWFGLTFEVPIVVIVLVRMGLVSVEKLRQIRSYVIVAAFAIAAVVAPPDIMSMLFMAVPLCLLYEVGIFVAPLFVRVTQAPEEATSDS